MDIPLEYVRSEGRARRIGTRLMAIVAEGPQGRVFLPPVLEHEVVARSIKPENVPETELPKDALGFRVKNYGITRHCDLFTARQLVAMTTFCDLVAEAKVRVQSDAAATGLHFVRAQDHADAVATYLGLGVGRLSDILNGLCSWESSKTQVRHLFTRHAIPLIW